MCEESQRQIGARSTASPAPTPTHHGYTAALNSKREKARRCEMASRRPVAAGDGSVWALVPRPVRSAYRRVVPRLVRVFLRTRSRREVSQGSGVRCLGLTTRPLPPPQWIVFGVWAVLQKLSNAHEWGVVFFIASLIALIFANLNYGERAPGLSAYSVMNPNCERLAGTLDAAEVRREGGVGASRLPHSTTSVYQYDRLMRAGGGFVGPPAAQK